MGTPAPIVGWRAWYTGDQVFDSDDTDWTQLPRSGFLAAVGRHQDGRTSVWYGQDFVWADTNGEIFQGASVPQGVQRKFFREGTLLPDAEWELIRQEVDAYARAVASITFGG